MNRYDGWKLANDRDDVQPDEQDSREAFEADLEREYLESGYADVNDDDEGEGQ